MKKEKENSRVTEIVEHMMQKCQDEYFDAYNDSHWDSYNDSYYHDSYNDTYQDYGDNSYYHDEYHDGFAKQHCERYAMHLWYISIRYIG